MQLFHGTTQKNLSAIQSEGVTAPSYWGTEAIAREYAASFGDDGIVLVAEIDESDLEINTLVAEQPYEDGDIEEMPDQSDLSYSLEYLVGVVCTEVVVDFVLIQAPATEKRAKHSHDDGLSR